MRELCINLIFLVGQRLVIDRCVLLRVFDMIQEVMESNKNLFILGQMKALFMTVLSGAIMNTGAKVQVAPATERAKKLLM